MGNTIVEFALSRPRTCFAIFLILTGLSALRITSVQIDTDPENMLGVDEPVRVFHNRIKKEFDLADMIIVGVVDETNENGVFNPATLGRVHLLTRKIELIPGVIARDMWTPSTVDDIRPDGPGVIRFQYLMEAPPNNEAEADLIRRRAMANPLFFGTMVSEDGKAMALYVPIEEKSLAHRVSTEIQSMVAAAGVGSEAYHIAGLPVAEDTFGVEMFRQMAVSAPLAGLLIFLLMFLFFRQLSFVVSPMIVAMLSVIITMGTLITFGFTVHIMSSMIPIFLMPIAVVDSVHILSVFYDRYPETQDRRATLRTVMKELFRPMLFTTLTTMAGFGSLVLAPIPPVRVFGVFVALGVGVAWICTITLVPAYIVLFLSDAKLAKLRSVKKPRASGRQTLMGRFVDAVGGFAINYAKWVVMAVCLILVVSGIGISQIEINDNPVKWFAEGHPIRIADRELNAHFGGTYEAYLVLETQEDGEAFERGAQQIREAISALRTSGAPEEIGVSLSHTYEGLRKAPTTDAPLLSLVDSLLSSLHDLQSQFAEQSVDQAEEKHERTYAAFSAFEETLETIRGSQQTFKQPEILRYVETLQKFLTDTEVVGKTNGLPEILRKVHQELFEGDESAARIPDTTNAVAQCLLSFQGSHRPEDLWHFVSPDYRKLNLWVQLKRGDNQDMDAVVALANEFFETHPPPSSMRNSWAGLTYLNVVWQNQMVRGMLLSLLGAFAVVFVMMILLFRSFWWGVVSMVPLSITIALVYGVIGLVGKEYDMPVAVLSSLALGMSVDFAIHFIERARAAHTQTDSWHRALQSIFDAPARAILRNALVVSLGFAPLLFATLMPYKTVGVLIAAIMAVSALVTLIFLPSLILTVHPQARFQQQLITAGQSHGEADRSAWPLNDVGPSRPH